MSDSAASRQPPAFSQQEAEALSLAAAGKLILPTA